MDILVRITRQENAEYFGRQVGDTVSVPFEEYIAAVTASEIGNSHLEACKAQAVAARSFAVSRGVLRGKAISDASSTAQAYRAKRYSEKLYPNCIQAANLTAGEVLTYSGKVISAVYSASNGGRTVSSAERWGGNRPYLIAQDDPWDAAAGTGKNGHGVGMSQRGAKYAAKTGAGYREILSFYYPGTALQSAYGQNTEVTAQVATILNDKALKIISNAQSMIGYPYVFGAVGEDCTPAKRGRRVNASYPTIKSKCQVLNGSKSTCEGCKYEGMKIFDCRGFTYYLLKQVGISISTVGATTQYNTAKDWERRGEIKDMPDVVCCVFKHKDGKMSHTGMHVGGGKIIHCSGEVKTGKTSDKGWTHYAIPKGLYTLDELNKAGSVIPVTLLKKGSTGSAVVALQEILNKLGYNSGTADGIFGAKTEAAVRAFQSKEGLTVDGIVGENTQAILAARAAATTPPEQGEQSSTEDPIAQPTGEYAATITVPHGVLENLLNAVNDFLPYLRQAVGNG